MNTPATSSPPARRLDPCPCGSGRRFKDCHGKLSIDPRLAAAAGLRHAGDAAGAKRALEAFLVSEPTNADAWTELGRVEHDVMDLGAAKAAFRRAIELAPPNPEAHFCLGLALLLEGEEAEGWAEYEWRTRVPGYADYANFPFGMPRWRGESLAGKRVLVHAEQGQGDTIQFARFLAPLAATGASIDLFAQPSLAPLLGRVAGVGTALSRLEERPTHDFHMPIIDVAIHMLRAGCARWTGTYISALDGRVAEWKPRVPGAKPRVAFAWKGSAKHLNDHNRSLPRLEADRLASAVANRIDIQLGETPLEAPGALDAAPGIRDWDDTAAVLASTDILVTVDTAVAHLAGAMGVETWILLPFSPDWRWGASGDTTDWYPGAKLFRQGADRRWGPVIDRVVARLGRP